MIKYVIAAMIAVACVGCGVIAPNGDQEAVVIKKPWFFGHGGVMPEPVSAGRSWCAPTTSALYFTITPTTATEEFNDLITKDNTPVTFHAYLKLQVKKGETPTLYKNFGSNWYVNSLQPTFRTTVRDKACEYRMFDLASDREVTKGIEDFVNKQMTEYCNKLNLPVSILQVTIGAVTPPPEVLEETRRTAAQNQSELTQIARAKAELARKQAEINKAMP